MADCSYCGEKISLPFKCKLCSLPHCSAHRLPENHNCVNISSFNTDEYRREKAALRQEARESRMTSVQFADPQPQTMGLQGMDFWNTGVTWKDLGLLTLLISGTSTVSRLANLEYDIFLLSILFLTTSIFGAIGLVSVYFIRERVSDSEGLHSEFYFWKIGTLITVIVSVLIGFSSGSPLIGFFLPGYFIFVNGASGRAAAYSAFGFVMVSVVLSLISVTSSNALIFVGAIESAQAILFLGILTLFREGRDIYRYNQTMFWGVIISYIVGAFLFVI